MKPIRALFLLLLAVSAPCLARAEETDPIKKDVAQLQGEWSMTSGIADGFEMPESMLPTAKRACTNNEVSVTVNGQTVMKAKFTIDPSKTPKTIDYDVTDGPNKGKKLLGIYEIEGDAFKSCFAAPGAERPTDFTSKTDSKRTLSTWKRTKAAQKTEPK